MDKATILGLVLGLGAIVAGQILEGGKLHSILQFTAGVIVFGGTFGAVFISYPLRDVTGALKGMGKILREPPQDPFQIIHQITTYANKARREGILSLEREIKNVENPFLTKALTMAVDGIEPHVIREAMESELEYANEYGKVNTRVFRSAGGYAPTIGILGAVLGLIHVMENLSDPTKLGAGIAVAFVATVYGVGSANLLFLPFATKLEIRQRHEMITNEMILEGVVALSTGENPRLIEEKLISFLPELQKTAKPPGVHATSPAGATEPAASRG